MFSLCSDVYLNELLSRSQFFMYEWWLSTSKSHTWTCVLVTRVKKTTCFMLQNCKMIQEILRNQTETIKIWLYDQSYRPCIRAKSTRTLCLEIILRKSNIALDVWYLPYGAVLFYSITKEAEHVQTWLRCFLCLLGCNIAMAKTLVCFIILTNTFIILLRFLTNDISGLLAKRLNATHSSQISHVFKCRVLCLKSWRI